MKEFIFSGVMMGMEGILGLIFKGLGGAFLT